MKIAVPAIGAFAIFLLSACGSPPQTVESYTSPPVGSVVTRGIGDSLIRQDVGFLLPATIDIKTDSVVGSHRLPKGTYAYSGYNATGVWFYEREQYFYLRRADNFICIDKTKECAKVEHSVEMKISSLSTNSFQQTLLYSGRIGSRITLGYREFSNDLARPAFSNNVEYDLGESTVVGYKGARLEVIKATNTEITYKILAGFIK